MVVSNTSPLMNLAIIGRLDLLRQFYEMEKLQREAHFWISPPLFEKLLRSAGE